jgi:hypothetical protein
MLKPSTFIPLFNIILHLCFIVPLEAQVLDIDKQSAKMRRFVSDVVYVVKDGNKERYSKRLADNVIVKFHGSPEHKAITEKHLNEFFQITNLKRLDEEDPNLIFSKIDIYLGNHLGLVDTAKKIDREIRMDSGSYAKMWWVDRKVSKSFIFISTDKFRGDKFEDELLGRLLCVFGLPSESDEYEQSLLSNKPYTFTSLQPIDRALLEFYYRFVPAGTRSNDLSKIFKTSWGVLK